MLHRDRERRSPLGGDKEPSYYSLNLTKADLRADIHSTIGFSCRTFHSPVRLSSDALHLARICLVCFFKFIKGLHSKNAHFLCYNDSDLSDSYFKENGFIAHFFAKKILFPFFFFGFEVYEKKY